MGKDMGQHFLTCLLVCWPPVGRRGGERPLTQVGDSGVGNTTVGEGANWWVFVGSVPGFSPKVGPRGLGQGTCLGR